MTDSGWRLGKGGYCAACSSAASDMEPGSPGIGSDSRACAASFSAEEAGVSCAMSEVLSGGITVEGGEEMTAAAGASSGGSAGAAPRSSPACSGGAVGSAVAEPLSEAAAAGLPSESGASAGTDMGGVGSPAGAVFGRPLILLHQHAGFVHHPLPPYDRETGGAILPVVPVLFRHDDENAVIFGQQFPQLIHAVELRHGERGAGRPFPVCRMRPCIH